VRLLHVANGTSTTMTIAAAGLPGRCSIWADPLYEGPVPAGLDDDAIAELRGRFLSGGAPVDPVNDMRSWRDVIADVASYDELVLWFEHDLFDQLNLLQLLTFIRQHVPPTKPVCLICIDRFPGRRAFHGLGELAPSEIASLFPGRQPVADATFALAARAWTAFREPSPMPLDGLRRGDTAALPFLGAALERLLEEYPWICDGLSRTERRLLQLARDGAIAMSAVWERIHDGETAYYVTDLSLEAMATSLGSGTTPLIAHTCAAGSTRPFWRGHLTITDAGRAVLDGRADRVAVCGLDRWIGGVHLQRDGAVWRWDPRRQQVVPERQA